MAKKMLKTTLFIEKVPESFLMHIGGGEREYIDLMCGETRDRSDIR